ncbi:MAG TPA: DNA-3-methyladenine glycosylase I [Gordonia sp. (in: high G+C Gram-positive bacteria)]|uniref:DNA-3-methyladenine glycosylase I n=1 Tax=unclassified Gordonia (in: high G+C Gram-positive bacteria) TaxID=2657482 RepID=UPI000FAE54C8|nr:MULTISPECIES: DNA-3-methyladenine glycosylase I [unclassified Gordonia (in: high G+C Gram-positive bacteria)]RUP37568.1 MAG: DNA-3-methyladenine glycosylase I [Gordonia sp. (in: high G+C Gram-positive bacteria)]HNP56514.1 DNA-3-methyladenine glycosylase I [Gordonia sp. (in: high G+C Gram-positive bacteria)]HRC50633.1 DNA-3-methyladenine glycosylase I [Gordonia sp. (in: high G+C Gram-positive bacteria)]
MDPFLAPDGEPRCGWAGGAPEMLAYHDAEWGFPVGDDIRLFEKICLEGFQSGLSWRTILNKRDNFRKAFAGFDFHELAQFDEHDVERLLGDTGIIRHRGKIEAAINNARRAVQMQADEGSVAAYIWRFEPGPGEIGIPQSKAQSATSVALSKDLRKRGWKFVGPTTAFAFMQSMGLVNDHQHECITRPAVESARRAFTRPS